MPRPYGVLIMAPAYRGSFRAGLDGQVLGPLTEVPEQKDLLPVIG